MPRGGTLQCEPCATVYEIHFDHLSPSGGSVFFKRPDMFLICAPKFVTYVFRELGCERLPAK